VAEIPEHLLARSKARRAALTGGDGAETPAATPASTPSSAASVAAATPAPAAPAATKAAKAEAAIPAPVTPVIPRGQTFSRATRVLLMVGMPVWAFFYSGIFATPKSTVETPQQLGARLYAAQCASCHLANGAGQDAGGVGRALWKGEAELTFPKLEEQIAFVRHGSCQKGVPYGNPDRPGGEHKALSGMPAFPDLTDEQIWAIITYERTVLSEKPWPELTAEELAAGEATLPTTIAPTTENVCRG
jgi:mono/diheme cytochrome c family protein